MWTIISFAFLAVCSLGALGASLFAVLNARLAMDFRPRELLSLESRLQSVEQSLASTEDALLTLANRMKMQKVRAAANHIPDPEPMNDKDALRRRAGIVAGQPAPHR